jgi:hypothetical protein
MHAGSANRDRRLTIFTDAASMPTRRPFRGLRGDTEFLIVAALIAAAVIAGLWTVSDYGITVDEYNADDYGPKALAWYTSGFTDRRTFTAVEETLWYYGPWFHILITFVQSLGIAEHWTTRHAMNFLLGIAGIAALFPIARLAIGRWAGLVAVGLCLTTGYLYGSIFFTPIDVPFLFAMTWATFAVVLMSSRVVPSWPATIAAGIFTGLAFATRSSGMITHAYLAGAIVLCALEVLLDRRGSVLQRLLRIVLRAAVAVVIAWITAIALWPWLQSGNPLTQFWEAFKYFANHPMSFEYPAWGRQVKSNQLPWSYVLEQLAARLPEGFLFLLIVGLGAGVAAAAGFLGRTIRALASRRTDRLREVMLTAAQSRTMLIVWVAAILPIAVVIVQGSTLYDGIRHVLFVIPMLALLASYGFVRLLPLLRRFPIPSAVAGTAYVVYAVATLVQLHPLQYVSFNVFAGGVHGAYARFDQDYWSVAANTALRRLESRLDLVPNSFGDNPPRLMICIDHRVGMVTPMHRRPWRLADHPDNADYLIETERWRCARKQPFVLIDEVRRGDRTFSWIYARQSPQAAVEPPSADR